MTALSHDAPTEGFELSIDRHIAAPRRNVWRCWTEAELLKQWFCPKPWHVPDAEIDVRPGGASRIEMRGPDGEGHMVHGVYLEVVEGEKLVLTDAYTRAWVPSEKPFMTAIVTMSDENGGTRYRAVARHWSEDDRKTHEEMGFHEGWGKCADQLEQLAQSLGS